MKGIFVGIGFMFLLSFSIFSQDGEDNRMILVIDAGHGGNDPGNLHQTTDLLDEKDLNLSMALKLGDYIDQFLGHKIKVVYTRTTDVYIALEDRVALANNINAAYFISIHCNASDNKSAHGTETHVHNLESKVSVKLAHQIQNQFLERAGRASRGVKFKNDRLGNLLVLRNSKMPAVLVETGFMTNVEEEQYLNTEKGRDIIASAIFRAFRDFVKKEHNIDMKVDEQPQEVVENKPVWKIQIMASTGPVGLENPDFISTEMEVEELEIVNPTSAFNYKYYVGAFYDKKEAKETLKKVREGVFKDAFLVKFE